MTDEGRGIGFLARLRLGLSALLGDTAAKQSQEAIRRLDEYKRWHTLTFGAALRGGNGAPQATPFRADLQALQEYGGAERSASAAALAEQLSSAEREGQQRLSDGCDAVEARQPEQALQAVAALEGMRATAAESMERYRSLADTHRTDQRAAWDVLATSATAARAGRLIQVLDTLPDIPQLPRPDVRAFAEPYEQAIALVPAVYRDEESDAICFDATEVARLAAVAVAAAPAAEAALTRYLYDAARGYEAALGHDRAVQIVALLRDPAAVRDLRARRPELFEDNALAAGSTGAGVDLVSLLLVTSLLAEHAPSWQPHPAMASGPAASGPIGPAGPPGLAPADISAWLSSTGAPSAAEWREAVAATDAESASDGGETDQSNDSDDADDADAGDL